MSNVQKYTKENAVFCSVIYDPLKETTIQCVVGQCSVASPSVT